jgi:hypothetical protein
MADPEPTQTRAERFLAERPALREARGRSTVWPDILTSAAVRIRGERLYVVRGDTLGGEDELFLDRLARGAREAGSDPLSRALFLELPPELQEIVQRDLLRQ